MNADIIIGDCREALGALEAGSVQTCVTSPPYWNLRDYDATGQIGLEDSPEDFVAELVEVFRGVRRVLADDGTLWLNLGDCYAGRAGGAQGAGGARANRSFTAAVPVKRATGLKPKDLVGIPWMVAFALRADGWYLRSDIIWSKPNPMPESVSDRPTKAHEYIFLLTKSERYYYDADAIREPLAAKTSTTYGSTRKSKGGDALGKVMANNLARDVPVRKPRLKDDGTEAGANKRSVWTVATHPFKEAHFATFPAQLITPCVLAGSRPGDVVLDPFNGAGTTGIAALRHQRNYVGIELNPGYAEMAAARLCKEQPLLHTVSVIDYKRDVA